MKVGDRVYSSKRQMTGTVVGRERLVTEVVGRQRLVAEREDIVNVSLDQMDLFLGNRPVWFYEKDLEAI